MSEPLLELRAKGWSLSRIAERLNIAQRTLVDWNREEQEQIRALRPSECEALQERSSPAMSRNWSGSKKCSTARKPNWPNAPWKTCLAYRPWFGRRFAKSARS
jgi:hypothetical protein